MLSIVGFEFEAAIESLAVAVLRREPGATHRQVFALQESNNRLGCQCSNMFPCLAIIAGWVRTCWQIGVRMVLLLGRDITSMAVYLIEYVMEPVLLSCFYTFLMVCLPFNETRLP